MSAEIEVEASMKCLTGYSWASRVGTIPGHLLQLLIGPREGIRGRSFRSLPDR